MVKLPYILKEKEAYNMMTDMVLFQPEGKDPIGVLLVEATDAWTDFMASDYGEECVETLMRVLQIFRENLEVKSNEDQYRKLYNMTDLFHSTMDIDLILENVLKKILGIISQNLMLSLYYRMIKTAIRPSILNFLIIYPKDLQL